MTRRQLTLFVPDGAAPLLEPVRRVADPVQWGLIAAHVTLCREDEIATLEFASLRHRLAHAAPITLTFGAPRRFAGHGMLLPCVEGVIAFQQLRARALDATMVREHDAHLTLAHPRNPRAAENVDATFAALPPRCTITFDAVAVIEQRGTAPWVVLETIALTGAGHGVGA
ncbi:MAG: 2'-5' RNA ligase family protein [Gemmatimonadetes bacterium]|nr:2'-5' RNA ligase family protein [Gemmatimonadota bacterium]